MIECRHAKRKMDFLTTSSRTHVVPCRTHGELTRTGDRDASPEPKHGNEFGSGLSCLVRS